LGLLVDRQVTVQGSPREFIGSVEDEDRAAYERVRERVGTKNADRFMKLVRDMRADGITSPSGRAIEDDDAE
jgi:hypothetical protein